MVKAKADIITLINLFNGQLFLEKKQAQFAEWVSAYNLKYGTNLTARPTRLNHEPRVFLDGRPTPNASLHDGWLSGFLMLSLVFSLVFRPKRWKKVSLHSHATVHNHPKGCCK